MSMSGYALVFLALLVMATGSGLFKPIIGWHLKPVDIIINPILDTGREKITLSPVASATFSASAATTGATAAGSASTAEAAATAEAWRRHLWCGPVLLRSLIPLLR